MDAGGVQPAHRHVGVGVAPGALCAIPAGAPGRRAGPAVEGLAESGDGWDVLHLSGHGGAGEFLLGRADGSPDPVSTAELIKLLRPLLPRLKLAWSRRANPRR